MPLFQWSTRAWPLNPTRIPEESRLTPVKLQPIFVEIEKSFVQDTPPNRAEVNFSILIPFESRRIYCSRLKIFFSF